jgi:Multiubiquitin
MEEDTATSEPFRIEEDLAAIKRDEEALERDTERLEHDLEEERRSVDVTVNNQPVRLEKHRVTGQEIIDAAIAQHVDIEADFVLSERRGEDWVRIRPNEEVTVRSGASFRAVSPDDNS